MCGPMCLHAMCTHAYSMGVNAREQFTDRIRRDMDRQGDQQRRNETETQREPRNSIFPGVGCQGVGLSRHSTCCCSCLW